MSGRRRKLKAVTLAGSAPAKESYDLRAEYIGGVPADAGSIEVENPLNRGQKILLFRKLRDDPLGRMQDHKEIDQAQYDAGRRWQSDYECYERGAQAIDPTKEAVDGGQIARSAISDAQAKALLDLTKAGRALGMFGESIVRDVLARGMLPGQVAVARGYPGGRGVNYFGRRFRECLNTLAEVYGYAGRKRA